jgi:hypothetical protein
MTTPCERAEDIKEIKLNQREMGTDIKIILRNQTANTIDIVRLQTESKKAGGRSGGVWGAVASIIIALASIISAKAGF